MRPRILFIVNDTAFFVRHRGMLADAARAAGFDVHVATPRSASDPVLASRGFVHHPFHLSRGTRNPIVDLVAIVALLKIMRSVRPTVAHLVTIKPILYGGVLARLLRVPAVFSISGLGYVFLAKGLLASLLRGAVRAVYRWVFGQPCARVIFQNPDDLDDFVENCLVDRSRAVLIRGNGLDLDEFAPTREPEGEPLVVLPARMLKDKGVLEFVTAARSLRAQGVGGRFALVGPIDSANPSAVSPSEIEEWVREGAVEWWGHRDDMPEVFARASIVCLPSYREGIPRALLEAAAAGRAVVTTDVPGCRDAVRPGHSGLLVPARDARALADALRLLLENRAERERMGQAGRSLIETELDPSQAIRDTVSLYVEATGSGVEPAIGGVAPN